MSGAGKRRSKRALETVLRVVHQVFTARGERELVARHVKSFDPGETIFTSFAETVRSLRDLYWSPDWVRRIDQLALALEAKSLSAKDVERLREFVWSSTAADFKGVRSDGTRALLHLNERTGATESWPLESFSAAQLLRKLPEAQRAGLLKREARRVR